MRLQRATLERLDAAAKATVTRMLLSRMRIPSALLTGLFLAMMIKSKATTRETFAGEIIACLAVVATILLWSGERHALHAFATVLFALGISTPLLNLQGRHILLNWTAESVAALSLVGVGFSLFNQGNRLAAVQTKSYRPERSLVNKWLHLLVESEKSIPIIEFSERRFATGEVINRALNLDNSWVIATFKNSVKERNLVDYRVRDLDAIQLVEQTAGHLKIQVDGREISGGWRTL
jgi:hypothetical protein